MLDKLKHHWNVSSRREFFTRAGSGLPAIALASLLAEEGLLRRSHQPIRSRRRNRTTRRLRNR